MKNQYTKIIVPSSILSGVVKYYMIFRCNLSDTQTPISFPLSPSPYHFLCFYTSTPASLAALYAKQFQVQSPAVVVGPHDKLFNIQLQRATFLVRVLLQPGALFRLSKIPMSALLNIHSFESGIVLPKMAEVNDKLTTSSSDEHAIQIIEEYLISELKNGSAALPIDFALTQLIASGGILSMDQLAALSYLSNRQMERQCLIRTGYTPKYIAKMSRFAKAWAMKEKYPDLNWNSIAYSCNYYDLQHLKKDFKLFAAITPSLANEKIKEIGIDLKNDLIFE